MSDNLHPNLDQETGRPEVAVTLADLERFRKQRGHHPRRLPGLAQV